MDETLEITRAGLAEHLTTELRDKHPDMHFDTESSDQWSVRVLTAYRPSLGYCEPVIPEHWR